MPTASTRPERSSQEQLPRLLRPFDDARGLVWRSYNLIRRASLVRSLRFARAWLRSEGFSRPVFIVGVPRSGTTLLFRLLRAHSQLGSLPREGHDLWRAFHHPRASGWASDRVGAGEVRRGERRFVRAYLRSYFDQARFVEKTPENSLRVPYLLELFPDALFIEVRRDPCAVINSLINCWRHPRGRYRSYFVPEELAIPGYPSRRRWCFALIEGWRELRSSPIPEIAFAQWRCMVEALAEQRRALAPERWLSVALEELLESPGELLTRVLAFAELPAEPGLRARLDSLVAEPVNALSPAAPGRWWRQNASEIGALLPAIAPLAPLAGYEIDAGSGSARHLGRAGS